jgi:hypothetical protein
VANKHPREKGAIMSTDERMEKMEGQLARIRWVNRCLIACIVLSLAVWFISRTFGPETAWAKSGVKEIRANKFVLEDGKGKSRALLGVDEDGPKLALLDEKGKNRALVVVEKDGPALCLFDEKGQAGVLLSLRDDGPNLGLYDWQGQTRVGLGMGKDGPMERPGLVLCDGKEKTRAVLALVKYGPGLALCDEDGKVIWKAP